MLIKILNFFRTIFIILCLLFFTNNAFALKLKLNLKDAIDKVTDEIENKLNDEDNLVNVESGTQLTDKNLIIEIDEDISKVKIQDLKKLKTRDMEKVLFGTVSLGFYENGDTFIDIHHLNKSNEEGQYESKINDDQNFNGVYKIVQSKICYLLSGVDDWQCAWLYKSKKQKDIYYWAIKGKVFAKIVNILDISEYETVKSNSSNVKENSEETVVAKKNKEDNKKNTEEEVQVEVEKEINLEDNNENIIIKLETFKKNPNNLPLCEVNFMTNGTEEDCWGIIYYAGNTMQQNCVGNCPVTSITETAIINNKVEGLLIEYYEEVIAISTLKDFKYVGTGLLIEGWGLGKRSECKISSTKLQNDEWVYFDEKDCSSINNLNNLNMNLTSFKCPGPGEYPYDCEIIKTNTNTNLYSSNENKITTCSELENKIQISEKGYKDIFFGMTEDEFKLLGKCNGDHTVLDLEANMMGDGLKYLYLYKYPVNAVFNGIERMVEGYKVKTVSKIIVNTYTEYHDEKKFANGNTGFVGIDEIRDILKKKYTLVSEPTEKDINLYNEFNKLELDRPKLDYVFKNENTNNLIIYRIYNSQTKLDWFYVSEIHYLSKEGSNNYLADKKSKEISEDDF